MWLSLTLSFLLPSFFFLLYPFYQSRSISVCISLSPTLSFFLSLSLALWNPASPSRLSLCLSLCLTLVSFSLCGSLLHQPLSLCLSLSPSLSLCLCLSLFFSLYLLSLFILFVDSIFKFVIPKISEICKQLSKIFICFYCNSLSYTSKRAFPNRPA